MGSDSSILDPLVIVCLGALLVKANNDRWYQRHVRGFDAGKGQVFMSHV